MTASFPVSPLPGSSPAPKKNSMMPAVRPAAITIGSLAVVIVVLQVVNSLSSYWLTNHLGIVSRTVHGLWGILCAPLLHTSWSHLLGNIIPLVVLGFLLMVGGVRQFVAVTVLVWLISGIGVWLTGPSNHTTIGASALVFGWLAYLVVRGFFNRSGGQIAVGILLLAIWGGIFWTGIVSAAFGGGFGNISWQGHLFGALGGVLAAFLVARADGPRRAKKAETPALTGLPPTQLG
jgi:membrane associated rhomboid family serine protease